MESVPKLAWFCIRTQLKREHIAASHLVREGVEAFLPRIRFKRPTRRGPVWFTEALFPSYLFARFDWREDFRLVMHARGVATIVHFGERWPTVPEDAIRELREALGAEELHVIPNVVEPGDTVEITEGAFKNLLAVVQRVRPAGERVQVLLEFLGRQTCVDVNLQALVKRGNVRAGLIDANESGA